MALQVILQTYNSVDELLIRFDVDCCAVAFDPHLHCAYMTPRARRAYEFGANIIDSRFNSSTYIARLHKYAKRGFNVIVPGFNMNHVSKELLSKNYVYIDDKDLLLEVVSVGQPQNGICTVRFADHIAHLCYKRCDEAKIVNGLARLVIAERGEIVSVQSPKFEVCSSCNMISTTPVTKTGFPILMHSNLPKTYHLLWDVDVAQVKDQDRDSDKDDCCNSEESTCESNTCQDIACEDVAGYACTPLAKAYDILSHLIDQHLAEQPNGHLKSGVSSRFFADIAKHNGEMCAKTCRQHYERSLAYKRKIQFVWDLVACDAEFEALLAIHDTSVIESDLDKSGSNTTCDVPKLLPNAITTATPRVTTEIDWFHDVY